MDKKKKLIIGGAVLVVVVLTLVVLLVCLLPTSNVLVAEEPKFELKDLRNMAPEDASALVAFQGFAKYLEPKYGKRRYLALAPVTGVHVARGESFQDVRFDSALGSVSVGVAFAKGSHFFHIRNITIETNDGDADKLCYVEDAAIAYITRVHYECLKPLPPFQCVRNTFDKYGRWSQIKVAELTISAVRVETNGGADDHKKGKFTLKPEYCYVQ